MQAAARLVTGEELEVELTEWELPMILDVFATWCGPCIQLKPEVEKVCYVRMKTISGVMNRGIAVRTKFRRKMCVTNDGKKVFRGLPGMR